MGGKLSYESQYSRKEKVMRQKEELMKIVEDSSDSDILDNWSNEVRKITSDPVEQWELFDCATHVMQRRGKHRQMVAFVVLQIELANKIQSSGIDVMVYSSSTDLNQSTRTIVAQSYVCLARANFLMSHYQRCIAYTVKSFGQIGHLRADDRDAVLTAGNTFLWRGKAHLGKSLFKQAIEDFEKCLSLSKYLDDAKMECLGCLGISSVYYQLLDFEKSIFFLVKAAELISVHGKSWGRHYYTNCQIYLAESYRKSGRFEDAMDLSEIAMSCAMEDDDRRSESYCLLLFGDMHRNLNETKRALPRYESANSYMVQTNDRYGQALVYVGKAKTYIKTNEYEEAIDCYKRALRITESIECLKLSSNIYGDLAVIYQRLSNSEQSKRCTLRYHQLLEDMSLFCGICDDPMGEKPDRLHSLPCSCIFHLKCAIESHLIETLMCPNCAKTKHYSNNTPSHHSFRNFVFDDQASG